MQTPAMSTKREVIKGFLRNAAVAGTHEDRTQPLSSRPGTEALSESDGVCLQNHKEVDVSDGCSLNQSLGLRKNAGMWLSLTQISHRQSRVLVRRLQPSSHLFRILKTFRQPRSRFVLSVCFCNIYTHCNKILIKKNKLFLIFYLFHFLFSFFNLFICLVLVSQSSEFQMPGNFHLPPPCISYFTAVVLLFYCCSCCFHVGVHT